MKRKRTAMANKKKKMTASKTKTAAKNKVPAKKSKASVKKKVSAPKLKPALKKNVSVAKKKTVNAKAKAGPVFKPSKPVKMKDYANAFTPLADRLVVRVVENEKITAGGIIIPDSASMVQGHLKGEVLAAGHGAKNKKGLVRPLDVQLGDFVLFAEYSGVKIEFNSEELQIVKESDIMGIVQK